MSLELVMVVCLIMIVCGLGAMFIFLRRSIIKYINDNPLPPIEIQPPAFPEINFNTKDLEKEIKSIPTKVLNSIQGSVSEKKGKLGELIGYMELKGQYDRIIPIGSIVDMICIRWPKNGQPGCVDLVDIKTGKFARLSKEQELLRQLIKSKQIGFVELKISQNRYEV